MLYPDNEGVNRISDFTLIPYSLRIEKLWKVIVGFASILTIISFIDGFLD